MKRPIYVILRHDAFHDANTPVTTRVTATKAYPSLADAEAERDRLQAVNPPPKCEYFVVLARLIEDNDEHE